MAVLPRRGIDVSRLEFLLVAAAVFLAPMNYFRLPNVYFTASDLAALCAVAVLLFRRRLPLRFLGDTTSFWVASFILLQAGLLIGSVAKGDPLAGIVGFAQYGFSLILLPMLICNRSFGETMTLIKVFIAALTLVMIHGIYAAIYTPDDLRFVSYSGRLTALVERENAAGMLVALAMTFSIFLLYIRQLRLLTFLLCLGPLAYGLMLTGSNTGFFMTGFGLLTLAVFSGSFRLLVGILAAGCALVGAIALFGEAIMPEVFVKRVMGALTTRDLNAAGTFTDRLYLMREALDIARDTLLVGLGTDQYRTISEHGAPVHNTYLLMLTEGSLLSLAGLLGLFVVGIFLGWRALQFPGTRMIGGLTLTIVVMYALAINGFAHVYARFWSVPFLLALGLSDAAVRARTEALWVSAALRARRVHAV